MPEMLDVAAFELAPDYAAANVRHGWLVDPVVTTLEIYRLGFRGMAAGPAFDAVELDLGSLWSR